MPPPYAPAVPAESVRFELGQCSFVISIRESGQINTRFRRFLALTVRLCEDGAGPSERDRTRWRPPRRWRERDGLSRLQGFQGHRMADVGRRPAAIGAARRGAATTAAPAALRRAAPERTPGRERPSPGAQRRSGWRVALLRGARREAPPHSDPRRLAPLRGRSPGAVSSPGQAGPPPLRGRRHFHAPGPAPIAIVAGSRAACRRDACSVIFRSS